MKTTEITTTNISLAYKRELKKMAEVNGMSQMAFLQDCIHYFKTTGINPSVMEPFSPKEEINKLSKRMDTAISFFQKHEKEKLQPLLDQMIIVSAKLSKSAELVSNTDLQEIKQLLVNLDKHQILIASVIKKSYDSEIQFFETMKGAQSKILHQQESIQQMIQILFQAISTKGISGVKQEYIDQFNQLKSK